METNINELIYLYHLQDESALESLIRCFRPMIRKIYRLIPRLTPSLDLQDFEMQADITLIQCLNRYRTDLNYQFSTYYINSVRKLSVDALRSLDRKSRKSHEDAVALDRQVEFGPMALVDFVIDRKEDTEQRVMASIVMEQLEKLAVETYGDVGLSVIRMRARQYSNRQIAREMNIPVARVCYILQRIRTYAGESGLI